MYYVSLELEGYPFSEPMEFETLEDAFDHARELMNGVSVRIEDEEGETY